MVKRILSEIIVTALAFLIKMKNLSLYSLIKKKISFPTSNFFSGSKELNKI